MRRFFYSWCLLAVLGMACSSETSLDGLPSGDTPDTAATTSDTDEPGGPDTPTAPTEGTWADPTTGLVWQRNVGLGQSYFTDLEEKCEALDLGDFQDWRAPTISELRSLIRNCPKTVIGGDCMVEDECVVKSCRNNFCDGCKLVDGPGYWPSALSGPCNQWTCEYWSGSEVPDGFASAWLVDFSQGSIISRGKGVSTFYYRCVRGEWTVEPEEGPDDDPWEEVWTDPESGLMWQRMAWPDQKYHNEAESWCDSMTTGGHKDWRLPTVDELRTLIHGCPATETGGSCEVTDSCLSSTCLKGGCEGCKTNEDSLYWPSNLDGKCCKYWSSQMVDDKNYRAWLVDFSNGEIYHSGSGLSYPFRVRCVR